MGQSTSRPETLWFSTVVVMGAIILGCSQLVIKEEDEGSVMMGKVMYRTVFAIGTLGYSEIKMGELTEEYEREQKLKAFETRILDFVRNGELTQAEADRLIGKEKARLWNEAEGEGSLN